MVEQWDQERVEKIIMVASATWHNRNKVKNGGKRKSSSALFYEAIDYLHEYQACFARTEVPVPKLVVNWTPPPPRRFKIMACLNV